MANRTAQDLRQEAQRSRVYYARIMELAAQRRRETQIRHAYLFCVVGVVLAGLAIVFRS